MSLSGKIIKLFVKRNFLIMCFLYFLAGPRVGWLLAFLFNAAHSFICFNRAAWKIEYEYKVKIMTHQLDFRIVDPTLMVYSSGNWAKYAKSQSSYFTCSVIRPEALKLSFTLTQEDETLPCC
jgi:hypothetical protein